MKKAVLLILAVVTLSACGGDGGGGGSSSSSSNSSDISGTWTGRANSAYYGGYINIAWTISQSGTSFTGNYYCQPGTLNCISPGGAVTGSIVGSNFTGNVVLTGGITCSFIGTVSGGRGSGNYNCSSNADAGTWTMGK